MNPVNDSLSSEEKQLVLQEFIEEATTQQDTVRIIHGHLYVANMAYRNADFSLAINHLLMAEQWAKEQGNDLLLGRIFHKKAAVYISLFNYEKSIGYFEQAEAYHLIARDSQYLGLTYEQLGAVYSYVDSFMVSEKYYRLALPVIKRHASEKSLAVFYANYGNLLSAQGCTEDAIESFQKALDINRKIGNLYQSVPCRQNIAWEYIQLNQYEKALAIYYECLDLCKANKWDEFLSRTYDGLLEVHKAREQYDSAFYYEQAYHHLNDSILGAKVQTDILEMETYSLLQEQRNQLQESEQLALLQKKRTVRVTAIAFIIVCIVGFGWYSLYGKHRRTLVELANRRNEPMFLLQNQQGTPTNKLTEDKPIGEEEPKTINTTEIPVSPVYPTSILTSDDWHDFKTLFEENNPGYLHRLRTAHPEMSSAEERLFVLLKLQLTTAEIANTLHIQQLSVKKTRSRLRKRLDLGREDSLIDYITNF